MKQIKLIMDLPINKACGATKGRVFDVTGKKKIKRAGMLYYFKGDNGDKCGAYSHECTVLNNMSDNE